MDPYPELSSSGRARDTVSRIAPTAADRLPPLPRGFGRGTFPPIPRPKPSVTTRRGDEIQLRGRMRKLGRGRGTEAQPFHPESEEDFRVIKSGEFYTNPGDSSGQVYRKR